MAIWDFVQKSLGDQYSSKRQRQVFSAVRASGFNLAVELSTQLPILDVNSIACNSDAGLTGSNQVY